MIKIVKDKSYIEKEFKEIFNQELKTNIYSNILVYEEDKVLGFLIYDLIYDRCEIEYIGVLKEYRNKHIASLLMEELLKKANNISLEVNTKNIEAINLYKKYGFKIVTTRKNYYENEDAYLMVRDE